MVSKPLRFHPQAEHEYLTSLGWYRDRSRIAAANFETAFEQAVERIMEAPRRWPIYFREFRKYILRQFPLSVSSTGNSLLKLLSSLSPMAGADPRGRA